MSNPLNKWLLGLLLVILIPLGLILLFPIFAGGHPPHKSQDISNMKQLALATIMYANDHHDVLPPAADWTDQVTKYLKYPEPLRCAHIPEAAEKDLYGHVLEQSMPGRNVEAIKEPETVPMLFDGVNLQTNAVSSLLDVRLTEIEGRLVFTVAFSDGHVKPRYMSVFDGD